MKELFVPYEQALALKELGFDEPCIGYYVGRDKEVFTSNNVIQPPYNPEMDSKIWFRAPLYQQAFRWFREKYNLKSWIQEHTADTFIYEIRPHVLTHYKEGETYIYDNYEKAELECLKKLIEIVKNK